MTNPFLTSYNEVFAAKLQRDLAFQVVWEAGETRRQVVSSLIGERIKRKLSQQDLARKAGVKQPSLARVESGNVMPSLKMLTRLAKAMNAHLDIQFVGIDRAAITHRKPISAYPANRK